MGSAAWLGRSGRRRRADGSVYSMRRALMPDGRVPVRLSSAPLMTGEVTAREELSFSALPLGDVNGDGRADLGACSKTPERCQVRSGSSASSYEVLAELGPCTSLTSADMDGDGFGDVWCATRDGDLALYRGVRLPSVLPPW